jgi:hypothetical protein
VGEAGKVWHDQMWNSEELSQDIAVLGLIAPTIAAVLNFDGIKREFARADTLVRYCMMRHQSTQDT